MNMKSIALLALIAGCVPTFAQDIRYTNLGDVRVRPGEELHLDLDGDGVADIRAFPSSSGSLLLLQSGTYEVARAADSAGVADYQQAVPFSQGERIEPPFLHFWFDWYPDHFRGAALLPTWADQSPTFVGVAKFTPGHGYETGWIRTSNLDGTVEGIVFHDCAVNLAGGFIYADEGGPNLTRPRFTPDQGLFENTQSVVVTSVVPDATIWYTTDGSEPGPGGTSIPSGGVIPIIATGTTIRSRVSTPDGRLSGVSSAQYTLKCATPAVPFSLLLPADLTLASSTIDAAIYYTLDGSDPSPSHGALYTGPLHFTTPADVRAKAFRDGFEPSETTRTIVANPYIRYVDPSDIEVGDYTQLDLDLDGDGDPDVLLESRWDPIVRGCVLFQFPYEVTNVAEGTSIDAAVGIRCPQSALEWYDFHWEPNTQGLIGVVVDQAMSPDGQLLGQKYGWMRLQLDEDRRLIVLDWAYEDQWDVQIRAGDRGGPVCPPEFSQQPTNTTLNQGESLSLSGLAFGPEISYQWLHNGVVLVDDARVSGATTTHLRIDLAERSDAGEYRLRATSPCGETLSQAAQVTVNRLCPPLAGSVMQLDGHTGVAEVPDDPRLDLSTAATIECWFFGRPSCQDARLVSKGDGVGCASDRAYEISYVGPSHCCSPGEWINVAFFFGTAPCGYGLLETPAGSVADETWHHVAGTFDSSTGRMTLLVDGVQVGETSSDTEGRSLRGRRIYNSSRRLELGATTTFFYTFLNGVLDEVRIWNVARTPEQIQANMNRTIDPTTPGLVAYYRFDEQGNIAHDLTVNHLDALLEEGASFQVVAQCCPADFNQDEGVDADDVIAFFAAWDANLPSADFNTDGGVDADDVIDFFARWDAGC